MKITIGIPVFNEEKNIGQLINRLKNITDSIIVCDDGSTDKTYEIVNKLGIIVVKHEKNMGYGAAINTIFEKSKNIKSDVLVTFDGDGQHNIEDIEKLIRPIKENKADIVIGSRFLEKNNEVPNYRRIGIHVITKVTNASIKQKLTDSQSGFRAYTNRVIEEISPSDKGMGISTEILIKASSKNYRIVEVPITIKYEGDTSTHNPVSHGTSVLVSTIKFTSIQHPLKFYGIPSIIFIGIGIVFTYFSIDYYSEIGRLNTNLTLISAGTLLLGSVLFLTAVLLFSIITVIRENKK